MKIFAFAFLILLAMTGVAMAADGAEGKSATAGTLIGIGIGMVSGIFAAVLGHIKNTDSTEKFEPKYAIGAVLIGAIVGAVAGWQKKDIASALAWIDTTAYTALAELIWKGVWRNGAKAVTEGLKRIKGPTQG